MVAREAGGFVFEKKVQTNAPKGDTFYIQVQITHTHTSTHTSTTPPHTFYIQVQITGLPEGPNGTLVRSTFKVGSSPLDR